MFQKISLAVLTFFVLAACTPQSTVLPELTPQTACESASHCVWAVRLDRCCDCGGIYTLQQVENDPRLLLPSRDYDYSLERIHPQAECQNVVCAPCMEPPYGLLCDHGNCREPRTAAEILGICPTISDPHRREWCQVSAAMVVLDQQGLKEAVDICDQLQGNALDGIPLRESCILSLARVIMDQHPGHVERPDPWTSVDLCRAELTVLHGSCLYEAAQVISQTEFEPALQVCESIYTDDEYNLWQRNACIDYMAYILAPKDYERAVTLCQRTMDLEQSCMDKLR
jgi:hypothetical protein